jgi:hypothetical protein
MAREVPAGQVVGDQDVRVAELGLAPEWPPWESATAAEWWDRWRACRWPPGRS